MDLCVCLYKTVIGKKIKSLTKDKTKQNFFSFNSSMCRKAGRRNPQVCFRIRPVSLLVVVGGWGQRRWGMTGLPGSPEPRWFHRPPWRVGLSSVPPGGLKVGQRRFPALEFEFSPNFLKFSTLLSPDRPEESRLLVTWAKMAECEELEGQRHYFLSTQQ